LRYFQQGRDIDFGVMGRHINGPVTQYGTNTLEIEAGAQHRGCGGVTQQTRPARGRVLNACASQRGGYDA
jgi:hypothetical protein